MGRVVAVKVLPRDRATPEAIASFTREIRAQAQFDHENLVRAFDAGHDGNVHFLVTEFVPGTDLRKLVRARGKLSMTDAATIISQAARGLAHAHAGGMVHRDVKPGNLLVTPEGRTKVSDLGLASFPGADDRDDPRAGRIVGTADYLSPEHIGSPGRLTPSSDIYSLGCTLYYAVTGKVPFPGGTTRDKARRHCEEIPLNPRRFNLDLSDEFVDVIAAMMEKDAAKRLQTMDEVVKRLAPWAGDSVATAVAEGEPAAPPSGAPLLPIPPSQDDTQPGWFDDIVGEPEESPSQTSQRTDPVASAEHETRARFSPHGAGSALRAGISHGAGRGRAGAAARRRRRALGQRGDQGAAVRPLGFVVEQCLQADLRPAFESAGVGQQFSDRSEAGCGDIGFERADLRALDVHDVYHAQVHLADFGLVIVDQPHASLARGRVDRDFLGQLAAHAFGIGGRGMLVARRIAGVVGRDVPADAHAAFAVQAPLPLPFAAGVLKHVDFARRIAIAKDHVGDQLLEAGVLFHLVRGR